MNATLIIPKDVLDRLREYTLLPAEAWDKVIGRAAPSDSPQLLRVFETDLLEIAEELSLDPTSIVHGEIDFHALATHQAGFATYLPDRYANGESRVRTSAHLFDVIETLYGWRERSRLLRRHQITEAVLADPELKVNVRLVTDICDDLKKLGLEDRQFFEIGEHSLVRNYHTPVGEKFRTARSSSELMEKCFTEVIRSHYDRNSIYRLVRLDEELAIVEAQPDPDVCDSLSSHRIGSRLTCLNRAGGFASLTGYRLLPFAEVRETHCIHLGEDRCRFEIDFSQAAEVERRAGTA